MTSIHAAPALPRDSSTPAATLRRIVRHTAAGLCLALAADAAPALPLLSSYVNADWQDADKLQGSYGGTEFNFWNDADKADGLWDKAEPLSDSIEAGWSRPRFAKDLSCWVASAADMLASAGFGTGVAQDLYWDMVYNMTLPWLPADAPRSGWQYPGWQHEALNWYLANRPHPLGGEYQVQYYGYYEGTGRDGTTAQSFPIDPFDFAADLLASGAEVGLVVHNADIWHAITFQGYFYDDETSRIDITDSDRHVGMLDHYAYASGSSDWEITDYISGGAPIDYFAVLRHVPTPGTLPLSLAALGLGWLTWRRPRQARVGGTTGRAHGMLAPCRRQP